MALTFAALGAVAVANIVAATLAPRLGAP
jgi:hypothetical protein